MSQAARDVRQVRVRAGRLQWCQPSGRNGAAMTAMTRPTLTTETIGFAGQGRTRLRPGVPLTPVEHALLRLLVSGHSLAEAAPALGMPLRDAERLLATLQARCGAPSATRLLVLAVLNVWV